MEGKIIELYFPYKKRDDPKKPKDVYFGNTVLLALLRSQVGKFQLIVPSDTMDLVERTNSTLPTNAVSLDKYKVANPDDYKIKNMGKDIDYSEFKLKKNFVGDVTKECNINGPLSLIFLKYH